MYEGTCMKRTANTQSAISATSPIPAMIEPSIAPDVRLGFVETASSEAGRRPTSRPASDSSSISTCSALICVPVLVIGPSLLRIQETANLAGKPRVVRMADDGVEAARARNRHLEVSEHPPRSRGHDDDSIPEKDCFGDAVRDQHDGLAMRLPYP